MKSALRRQNWLIDFLIEDKYRIYRHVLICVYLVSTEFWDINDQREYSGNHDVYRYIGKMLLFLLAVYINMYILVPQVLFKDRYLPYLSALVTLTALAYLLPNNLYRFFFNDYYIASGREQPGIFGSIIPNINILGVAIFASTSIKLFQRWKADVTRMSDLEKNSLETELRELKNQINPHFLFNMLNNVNALIQKDSERASTVVLKLSQFLRYQLYEAGEETVSLQSEIDFLDDLLELEKIRRDEFTFTITNNDFKKTPQLLLPPGLFLAFVENAVKHSADSDNPSSVDLSFWIDDRMVVFICRNTKPEYPAFANQGGLGLVNIKRRLELLYAQTFRLHILDLPNTYEVKLSIPYEQYYRG